MTSSWFSRGMKRTPITKVMSADLTTIQRGQRISEAYQIFKHAPFHHLPVLDGGSPVGVLSSTDILRLAYDVDGTDDRTLAAFLDHQFTIEDAMTPDPPSLPHTATVKEAAELLSDGAIHSLIVLDQSGGVAGIVTTTDLAQFLIEQFR